MFDYDSYVIRHNLNLFYEDKTFNSYEQQTDYNLNKVMNDFVQKCYKGNEDKTFVLESMNDYFTLIAYKILQIIQSRVPFKLKVCGSTSYGMKGAPKMSKRQCRKNKHDLIFISPANPLYYVLNKAECFNKFGRKEVYNLVERFTLKQFKIIGEWYGVEDYYDDIVIPKKFETDWRNYETTTQFGGSFTKNLKLKFIDYLVPNSRYVVLDLTGDIQKDNYIYRFLEKSSIIAFYRLAKDASLTNIMQTGAGRFMKYSQNAPNPSNIVTGEGELSEWIKDKPADKRGQVVIVNGPPAAGKTTFEKYFKTEAAMHRQGTSIYSIIDSVKDILKLTGWNYSKDPKDRNMMSNLKDLLSNYNDYPYQELKERIANDYFTTDKIIFIDARELNDIKRLKEDFGAKAILIRRKQNALNNEVTNHADNNVENFEYDYYIDNNGTLEELIKKSRELYEEFKE